MKKRKDPQGARVDKIFLPRLKAAGDRQFSFTISSPAVDREGDSVIPEGIALDHYKANPVVLYGHDYGGLPVAKCVSIGVKDGVLKATAEFVPAESYEFAGQVHDMIRDGFLSAVSIGFMAVKTVYNEVRRGFDVLESELLEFSIVPVPMHPDCLVEGRGAEYGELTKKMALGALQRVEPGGLWLTPDQVLDLAKGKSQVTVADPDGGDDDEPATPPPADPPAPAPPASASAPQPAPPAQDPPPLVVLQLAPDEALIHVTPEDVIAATRAAVSDLVGAELRRLSGRLD